MPESHVSRMQECGIPDCKAVSQISVAAMADEEFKGYCLDTGESVPSMTDEEL